MDKEGLAAGSPSGYVSAQPQWQGHPPEKEVLDFIGNRLQEINPGKVDQTWFLDLVLLKGGEARQAKAPRAAAADQAPTSVRS